MATTTRAWRWAWSVANELPSRARELEVTEQLRAAAAARLGMIAAASETVLERHDWVLPADTEIGVAWGADGLILRDPPDPGDATIQVPATNPRFLFIEPPSGAPRVRIQVEKGRGPAAFKAELPIELLALSGARYRVAFQQTQEREATRAGDSDEAAPAQPDPALAASSALQGAIESGLVGTPAGAQSGPISKFVPTVFVALGGSGKDVLMHLKKRFHDRFGTTDHGFARFLFIDSDVQSFVPQGHTEDAYADVLPSNDERVDCLITPVEFTRVFDALESGIDSVRMSWLKSELKGVGPAADARGKDPSPVRPACLLPALPRDPR